MWKPAGLASELPRDPRADSLVTRLSAQGFDDLRLVHRLDAPTSGVMLIARTPEVAAYYSAEIAARRWHKWYVAALPGSPASARTLLGDHKAYLTTDGRRAKTVRSGGKPSFLTITHVEPASDHVHALIRLHTGRFHQIRVMLAALGAPLLGDELYGGARDDAFYLEHVALGVRRYGSDTLTMWKAPDDAPRPPWSSSLKATIAEEIAALSVD